jgi:hypothetical protein
MPRWEPDAEALRKAVGWAMQQAFLAMRQGGGSHPPEDFYREGGKVLFRPRAFADEVAKLLIQRGFNLKWVNEMEGEDDNAEAAGAAIAEQHVSKQAG